MEDWLKVLLEVGVPVFMAAGGWLLAQERFKERTRGLTHKLEELDKKVEKLEQRIDSMPSGFKLEIGGHRDDIDDKLAELKRDIEKLWDKVDLARDSSSDFAKEAELAKFVYEINTRFENLVRDIAQLQGAIFEERRPRTR